jgi:hypothetical protein
VTNYLRGAAFEMRELLLEVVLPMMRFKQSLLVVVACSVLALPLRAAPAPTDEPVKIDKYLPDETTGVFVFNLKLIRESKAYTKGPQKTVDDLLKKDEVQAILKEAGLDPTKDLDRAVLAIVPGREGMGGPFVVFEGRFDPDKLGAAVESLGKKTGGAKKLEIGKVRAYEMSFGPPEPAVIAILNKNTVILATSKEEIEQAAAKADGKQKTAFKVKEMAKLIEKLDPKDALAAACVAEMPFGGSSTSNAGGVVTRTTFTLAKEGIESVTASFTITDVFAGKVTFSAKDAEGAKALHAKFEAGLAEATAELTKAAGAMKDLEPLLEVLKGIKLSNKEQSVTFEGKGGPEAIEAVFKGWFSARAGAPVTADK